MSIVGCLIQELGRGLGHLLESLTWLGGGGLLSSTAGTGPGKAGEAGASSRRLEKGMSEQALSQGAPDPTLHPMKKEEPFQVSDAQKQSPPLGHSGVQGAGGACATPKHRAWVGQSASEQAHREET